MAKLRTMVTAGAATLAAAATPARAGIEFYFHNDSGREIQATISGNPGINYMAVGQGPTRSEAIGNWRSGNVLAPSYDVTIRQNRTGGEIYCHWEVTYAIRPVPEITGDYKVFIFVVSQYASSSVKCTALGMRETRWSESDPDQSVYLEFRIDD